MEPKNSTPDAKGIVAVAPCGCVRGWCSGKADMKSDRAKSAAAWIRAGYEIRPVTDDQARSMPWDCAQADPPCAVRQADTARRNKSARVRKAIAEKQGSLL